MKKNLKNNICNCCIAILIGNVCFAQTSVQVADITNTGSNSWGVSHFNVTGNYSATAGANDQFYNVGSSPLYIQGSGSAQFSNLILNNAANVHVENTLGLSIKETLQSMGNIIFTSETLAGALKFDSLASLVGSSTFGATHFVDGYMQKSGNATFTFPLGNDTIYSPITFENPAGSTLRYRSLDPGNSTDLNNLQGTNNLTFVSSKEYYVYNGNAAAGYSVTLPYNNFGNEGYVGAIAKLTIAGWNGTEWLNLGDAGNSINLINKTVTVTLTQSLTGIEKLSLGSTDPMNVLAVNLLNFTAQNNGNCGIQFKWKIAADEAVQNIAIEKSTNDGAAFTSLKTLGANSNNFTASQEKEGTNYYRLKITTAANQVKYSNIIKLETTCNKIAITISPNPVKDKLLITGLQSGFNLTVLNAAGAKLISQQINTNSSSVNMQSFAGGLYYVIITNEKGIILEKKKIVKQ